MVRKYTSRELGDYANGFSDLDNQHAHSSRRNLRKYAFIIGGILYLAAIGLGLKTVHDATPATHETRKRILREWKEALERDKALIDSEYSDPNYVERILKERGVNKNKLAEYMAVFPWTDEIRYICKEWDIGEEKVPLYAGKVFVESSGDPKSVSKKWYARNLLGTRFRGAFDTVWRMVHSDKPRYKMLREKFPKIHAYFKKELKGVKDPLAFWKKKMIYKLDSEFGLRLGIAYNEIIDGEIEINDGRHSNLIAEASKAYSDILGGDVDINELDDMIAEVMYLRGMTDFQNNPSKAMKKSRKHVRKVWERKKNFRQFNRLLAQSRNYREEQLGIPKREAFLRKYR